MSQRASLIVLCSMIALGPAFAAEQPGGPAADMDAKQHRLLEEWHGKLTGTAWTLQLRPMNGPAEAVESDTLQFSDAQVTSSQLSKSGYNSSNYSLRLQGDSAATWETMQSKEGGEAAFWRGEVEGDVMRGVLSQRLPNGGSKDFSFVGSKTSGPTAAPVASQPAAAPAATAPSTPAVEAPTPAAAQPEAPAPAATNEPAVIAPREPVPPPQPATPPVATPKKKRGWW